MLGTFASEKHNIGAFILVFNDNITSTMIANVAVQAFCVHMFYVLFRVNDIPKDFFFPLLLVFRLLACDFISLSTKDRKPAP